MPEPNRICAQCGTAFVGSKYEVGKYCSMECRQPRDPKIRFERKVVRSDDPDGCWIWSGWLNNKGYGVFGVYGKSVYVHRFSYEMAKGPIPEGLELDHLCRTPACVNPAHLEAVTHRENVLRSEALSAQQARQTHCIHGHPFDEANTYIRKDNGGRMCRRCAADRQNARNRRLAAA